MEDDDFDEAMFEAIDNMVQQHEEASRAQKPVWIRNRHVKCTRTLFACDRKDRCARMGGLLKSQCHCIPHDPQTMHTILDEQRTTSCRPLSRSSNSPTVTR
jgi:hypothetical protein